jgi:hypothetical protein
MISKYTFKYKMDCSDEDKSFLIDVLGDPVFKLKKESEYDDEAWHTVLQDFVKFLGSVYGYDISNQVAIIPKKNVDTSTWTGPVVDPEEYL